MSRANRPAAPTGNISVPVGALLPLRDTLPQFAVEDAVCDFGKVYEFDRDGRSTRCIDVFSTN